tara:strand:+ start:492 stop:1571 length:1080 start_codon:yes stop_codon:yes gene_type:complete
MINIKENLMKKITIFLLFSTVLFCDGFSGVSYFEYHTGDVDEIYETHGFKLSRVYLTYKKAVSDQLSFKFQVDVGKLDDISVYDPVAGWVSSSNDDRWTVFLKKAQLDWKLKKDMKLSMGMIGLNMLNVQEKTWGHRFVEKSALDLAKWSATADLGIGISKQFTEDFSASLLLTNGEGYKESDNDNYEKISLQLLYGEGRLDKNDGYNFGVVYSTLDQDENSDPTITEENTDTVFGAFGGWAGNGLRIGFEYHTSDHDNFDSASSYTGSLSSVYLTYAINDNLSVIARTDDRNPNDDSSVVTDDASTEIFGLIWTPVKGLSICPNITKTVKWDDWDNNVATSETDDSISDVALNFQFKF